MTSKGHLLFWTVVASLGLTMCASAEVFDVAVINFEFVPADITIQEGDTVRWTNQEGAHNVVAQNDSFPAKVLVESGPWVHEVTFEEPAVHIYRCEPHSSPDFLNGMVGSITVEEADDPEPPPEPFAINFGITGSWFNPLQNGQGFSLEVVPQAEVMAAYWFTYPPAGLAKGQAADQMWLQGSGPIDGDTAVVTFQRPVGGTLDTPGGVQREDWGTATFVFSDCNTGVVTYESTADGLEGTVPIQRITADVQCEAGQ